jgi:hypothetical protein
MACVADPQAWFAPASRPFDITDRSTWSAINSEQVADLWLSQGAPSHLQPALQAIVDRASTNWPQQRHTASTPASPTSTVKSVASVQDSGYGSVPATPAIEKAAKATSPKSSKRPRARKQASFGRGLLPMGSLTDPCSAAAVL